MPFDGTDYRPETKPDVALESWRKVLMDAADYIEAHGWCNLPGGGRGAPNPLCASLAIVEASSRAEMPGVVVRFASYLGLDCPARIPDWNDTPGRTGAEVCAALRECARQP